jgi:hypothetical protein
MSRAVCIMTLLLAGVAPAHAASFVVTTTADSGAGSLRDAIDQANAGAGPDTINFAPGIAGQTIALASPLPHLTDGGTTIDADLGADCVPDIGIDGVAAGPAGWTLFEPGGHTLRGLAITRTDGPALRMISSNNTIACNYIGTNLAQAVGFGNNGFGIDVLAGPPPITGNTIGPGNLIRNNAFDGIRIGEQAIGAYPDFTALAPDYAGVFGQIAFDSSGGASEVFHTADNTITPLDGSGRPFTDSFGMRLRGELVVATPGDYVFTIDPLDDQARLTVAGTVELDVGGPGPHQATLNLGAGSHTLRLDYAEGGGFAAVTLAISGPGAATLNTNQQAVCPTGQPGLCGELFQLRIPNEGNRITQNAIHDNGGLGIRLSCCGGPLPNDAGDFDLGANTWLNTPVITGFAAAGGGNYTISGTAPANATIELFSAATDPSGSGEAQAFLGSTVATGGGTFALSLPLGPGGLTLTATATDAAGNTSEFSPNFTAGGGADEVYVGTPGATIDVTAGLMGSVPIRVRDASLSSLGSDRGPGNRIQGLAFRVDFPPGSVASASIAPAGITAGLTPLFGPSSSFGANSVNYLVSYEEATNPIPLTLDIAPPAEQVAVLNLTVAPNASPGPLAYTINPATELSNQAGTVAENIGNGGLSLVPYTINVVGNGPRGLYAAAQSTSLIRLTWFDPNLVETGFRVERSTDGIGYVTAGTVGPNIVSFDDTGLNPGTLYYYRVVTLTAGGDGNASNRATASTFPAVAARVCVDPATVSRRWARSPSVAFRGPEWGLAYHDRDDGSREQIRFLRLDSNTLAPLGPALQLTNSPTSASFPALAWNGTHYAVTWFENLRAAPGTPPATRLQFAQLDANGNLLRGPRQVLAPPPFIGFTGNNEIVRPVWDGTHWGIVTSEIAAPSDSAVRYRRLEPDGDVVVGPTLVQADPSAIVTASSSAWDPIASEVGALWIRELNDDTELRFQRIDEATGATQLPAPAVVAAVVVPVIIQATSLAPDPAGGWLAAWTQFNFNLGERIAYTRRIAPDGTPHAGGAVRVSHDPAPARANDDRPQLVQRPGGYALFVDAVPPQPAPQITEVFRYHLDTTGARVDGPVQVSTTPGRQSGRPRAAIDGARALVAWSESTSAPTATMEIAARLSDSVSGTLGTEVVLTGGHDPANTVGIVIPGQPRVAPIGAGFAAFWNEPDSGANLVHGRLYDGAGALVADYAPLSINSVNGRPGLASVGGRFAVVWRSIGNALRFAARSETGAVLVAETVLATGAAVGGGANVNLGWDGENYVALWVGGGQFRYLRITEAGAPIGVPVALLPLGTTANQNATRFEWMGDAWALVFLDSSDSTLKFARFGSDGGVVQPPVTISAGGGGFVSAGGVDLALEYNGAQLGVVWNEFLGPEPPGNDNFFTVVNRDGSKAFPQVVVNGGALGDASAQLYWASGRFHVVNTPEFGEAAIGIRDLEVNPDGTLPGISRFLANRASNSIEVAHNGATLGMAWRAAQTQDIHFETDACLVDATPPPCPNVSVASVNNNVRLTWPAIADPESGLWRHHVYRDAKLLAELPPAAALYDDSGYDTATTHAYQVRGFNRAFQESAACPVLNFSTAVGDANGNGATDVADVFYLINFTLASGPPPLGDGDANGDNGVSVTDIFFLINFFFGGGPTPTALAAPAPATH